MNFLNDSNGYSNLDFLGQVEVGRTQVRFGTQDFIVDSHINMDNRKEVDCRELYEFLIQKYGKKDCPALIFVDEGDTYMVRRPDGSTAVVLNISSGAPLHDLKRALRKREVEINANELLYCWVPNAAYAELYRMALGIADYLEIMVPPLYFVTDIMKCEKGSIGGVTITNGKKKSVGIIIVNRENMGMQTFGTLAHELRHVWQFQNGMEYVNDISESYSVIWKNYEEYALHPAEIDAFAFEHLVYELLGDKNMFDVHFEDEPIRNAVENQMKEMRKNLKPFPLVDQLKKEAEIWANERIQEVVLDCL